MEHESNESNESINGKLISIGKKTIIIVLFFSRLSVSLQAQTTIELRTSITAELDQMSAEMLESVSRYVSRLRRRARSSRRVSSVQDKREAAMLFVKNLSVQGGMPVPADESGIDALVDEKYDK